MDLSGVVSQVSEIRRELSEKGIEPSVRRFDRGCYLVRASAYLGGRQEANEEDLEPLRHVLWEETDQIGTVAVTGVRKLLATQVLISLTGRGPAPF